MARTRARTWRTGSEDKIHNVTINLWDVAYVNDINQSKGVTYENSNNKSKDVVHGLGGQNL